MAWSIAEVARASGISSRTLRHYHAIGLLPPAYVQDNGRRYYEAEQLLRLQRILLLRRLGFPLAAMNGIVNGNEDIVAALRRHLHDLAQERDRVTRLERTVEDTIARWEGAEPVSPERLFDGFREDEKAAREHEHELVERFGEQAGDYVRQGRSRKASWTTEKTRRVTEEGNAIFERLAELHQEGASLDDDRVLDAVDQHYRWIREGWDATGPAYIGLGEYYVESEQMRPVFDAYQSGFAQYLRDALAHYAHTRLM